jgi:hypothetical protein
LFKAFVVSELLCVLCVLCGSTTFFSSLLDGSAARVLGGAPIVVTDLASRNYSQ